MQDTIHTIFPNGTSLISFFETESLFSTLQVMTRVVRYPKLPYSRISDRHSVCLYQPLLGIITRVGLRVSPLHERAAAD